MLRFRL
ncbi:hypothetical protein D047_1055A, partial [Vibrio parahaemolyticus VPTS-2010_2]